MTQKSCQKCGKVIQSCGLWGWGWSNHATYDRIRGMLDIRDLMKDVDYKTKEKLKERIENPWKFDFAMPTPLHVAASAGYVRIVEFLLENGCDDINVRSSEGKTPLYLSAQNNNYHVMRILMDKGAIYTNSFGNIYARDKTPLSVAVSMDSFECIQLLINTGCIFHPEIEAAVNACNSVIKKPQNVEDLNNAQRSLNILKGEITIDVPPYGTKRQRVN